MPIAMRIIPPMSSGLKGSFLPKCLPIWWPMSDIRKVINPIMAIVLSMDVSENGRNTIPVANASMLVAKDISKSEGIDVVVGAEWAFVLFGLREGYIIFIPMTDSMPSESHGR